MAKTMPPKKKGKGKMKMSKGPFNAAEKGVVKAKKGPKAAKKKIVKKK